MSDAKQPSVAMAAEAAIMDAGAAVELASGLLAAAAAEVVTEAIVAGALVGWSGATDEPTCTRQRARLTIDF